MTTLQLFVPCRVVWCDSCISGQISVVLLTCQILPVKKTHESWEYIADGREGEREEGREGGRRERKGGRREGGERGREGGGRGDHTDKELQHLLFPLGVWLECTR